MPNAGGSLLPFFFCIDSNSACTSDKSPRVPVYHTATTFEILLEPGKYHRKSFHLLAVLIQKPNEKTIKAPQTLIMKYGSILAALISLAAPASVLAVWECHVTVWEGNTPRGTEMLKEGGDDKEIAGYTCRAGAGCKAECDGMNPPFRVLGTPHGEWC